MAKIVIYVRDYCGYCTAAVRLLEAKGAAFESINATGSSDLRAEMVRRSGGGRTFPQIMINEQPIGGCMELFELDQSGKLDEILNQSKSERELLGI